MKKIALFCAVAGLALGAIADDGMKFKFSSSGDTYANGDAVQDGEVYALVWVKTGASFAGFNADGTLKDAANNALEAVSVAQGGGCITTVFIVSERTGGQYYMYLLDTRMDVADENGNVVKKAAGLAADGKIQVVNEAIAVSDAEINAVTAAASLVSAEAYSVDGTAEATVAAGAVDESALAQPVVTAFTPADGGATLTVEGTVPYVQYRVFGGMTPSKIDAPLGTFLNGSVGGTLVLKVADVEGYRFFKVATK